MSRRYDSYGGSRGPGPRVDAIRLWAGGVAAAFVAAGIVIVGLLVARVLNVHVLINTGGGALIDVNTGWYAVVAAVATLVATGLMYLLLLSAPRPELLFTAIMGIVTALAVLLPFTATATLQSQVTVAAINLAVGVTVIGLISGFGQSVINQQRASRRRPTGIPIGTHSATRTGTRSATRTGTPTGIRTGDRTRPPAPAGAVTGGRSGRWRRERRRRSGPPSTATTSPRSRPCGAAAAPRPGSPGSGNGRRRP